MHGGLELEATELRMSKSRETCIAMCLQCSCTDRHICGGHGDLSRFGSEVRLVVWHSEWLKPSEHERSQAGAQEAISNIERDRKAASELRMRMCDAIAFSHCFQRHNGIASLP